MGALGALIMAGSRGRLSMSLLMQAMENTTKLAVFVLFILIGSTVFSFTFNAADGHFWVEHLFDKLPGGQLGFLIVVNVLVFILGMFIDFFEIAFIVIPLLVPVAEKLGIDLIWFGVIIAMNLQTSFLTPPFGFALFYLRSVAARSDYNDVVTKKRIPAVTTTQIYKGSIAFIVLQLIMVSVVIAYPGLVSGNLDAKVEINDTDVTNMLNNMSDLQTDAEAGVDMQAPASTDGLPKPPGEESEVDPAKALQDAMKQ